MCLNLFFSTVWQPQREYRLACYGGAGILLGCIRMGTQNAPIKVHENINKMSASKPYAIHQ